MATENILELVSREAGSGIVNKRFVTEVAGGKVNIVLLSATQSHGVVAMRSYGKTGATIAAGDECPVAKDGDVIVESGAAVADGAEVMADTTGRAITFAAGVGAIATGKVVNGSSASAAGQDLSVRLYKIGTHI